MEDVSSCCYRIILQCSSHLLFVWYSISGSSWNAAYLGEFTFVAWNHLYFSSLPSFLFNTGVKMSSVWDAIPVWQIERGHQYEVRNRWLNLVLWTGGLCYLLLICRYLARDCVAYYHPRLGANIFADASVALHVLPICNRCFPFFLASTIGVFMFHFVTGSCTFPKVYFEPNTGPTQSAFA